LNSIAANFKTNIDHAECSAIDTLLVTIDHAVLMIEYSEIYKFKIQQAKFKYILLIIVLSILNNSIEKIFLLPYQSVDRS